MTLAAEGDLRFGEFVLDLQRCALRRGERTIGLRPRAFDVLSHLASNPGRVVGKDELIRAVWGGKPVTDDAIVQCVKSVRQALSDTERRIVQTVPRRGYLFAAEAPRPSLSGPGRRHARTPDGVRLAIDVAGSGTPLVRPPTWFNHLAFDWNVQFRGALYRFLAERMQLIRYDGRGSGLSDRHVPDLSFAAMLEDLQAVVDELGLERYALLGISQGGPIAIAHAVRHPDRVSRLVLNGAYALGRNKRGSTRDLETGAAHLTLMRHGWGDEHSAFLKTFSMLYFPGTSADELGALAQLQRAAMTAEVAVRLRLACDDIDIMHLLPQVRVPTLVLHSRHDNAVPFEEGQRLAESIPGARFIALESENHVPTPQEPAWPRFVAEIESFLREG